MDNFSNDINFYGIPCIYLDGNYFIFSPYVRKCKFVTHGELWSDKLLWELSGADFFGRPKWNCHKPDEATLVLVVTTDCNMRCLYCYASAGESSMMMELDTAKAALKYILSKGKRIVNILFHGGEPTLNFKLIKEIVREAKKYKNIEFRFQICTNGAFGTKIADFMLRNKFLITLSMDGLPYVQDYQRPLISGISSRNVLRTIEFMSTRNAKFKILSIATNRSTSSMAESVMFLGSLGVKYLHYEPLNESGRAENSNLRTPNPDEYIDSFLKCLDVASKNSIKIISSAYLHLFSPALNYCSTSVGDRLVVGPSGDLSLCYEVHSSSHDLSKEFSVGVYNKRWRRFDIDYKRIENLKKKRCVEEYPECTECFAKYICSGGCPNRNIVQTGHETKRDLKLCRIKKGILHAVLERIAKRTDLTRG